MSYAISDIITWAKMSQAFAALDAGKKRAREGYLDPTLHEKLYVERKSLEWQYAQDPSYTGLFEQGNYVLALCGVYLFQAQNVSGVSGGITVPFALDWRVVVSFALDWRVSGSATATAPLAIGQTIVTFDGTGGMPDLRGYNIDFFRGGVVQYTTDPGDGSTYYSWNRDTGLFIVSAAAQLNEPMRITATSSASGVSGSAGVNTQKAPQTFKVGTTPNAPTAGAFTWQLSDFANSYVVMKINGGDVYQADMGNGNAYLTKTLISDTLTIGNYAGGWQTGDIIEITLITP